jgi:solute:Na+ symporter, SSS family
MITNWALLSSLAVISIAIVGYEWSKRKDVATASDLLLHSQNLTFGPLAGTLLATNLSLGNLLFVCATWGYLYSWSGLFWFTFSNAVLVIAFLLGAKRFRPYITSKDNFGSIHDFIARGHASDPTTIRSLRRWAAVLSASSLLCALIIEVHLATYFLPPLTGQPQGILVVWFVALIAVYTIIGGFKSVVFTDLIQTGLIIVGVACGVLFIIWVNPSASLLETNPFSLAEMFSKAGWANAFGLVLLNMGWLFFTPDTWQRNSASRSLDTSLKGTAIGGWAMVACVFLFCLFGMYVKSHVEPLVGTMDGYSKGAFPFNDIFLLASKSDAVMQMLLGGIAVALVMAAISTMDTFLIVMAHSLGMDMTPGGGSLDRVPEERSDVSDLIMLRSRLFIGIVAVVVFLGWFVFKETPFAGDPVSFFFITYSIQATLLIPVLFAGSDRFKSAAGARNAIILSGVVTLTVGIICFTKLTDGDWTFLRLSAGDWFALLPVFTIGSGLLAFLLTPRKLGFRTARVSK